MARPSSPWPFIYAMLFFSLCVPFLLCLGDSDPSALLLLGLFFALGYVFLKK